MNPLVIKRQRGQSTTEFIAAAAATLPLVLGVIYMAKYADIKHQTIQASRYAAMERALDPHDHEVDTVVQNETVARFFPDAGQHTVGYEDQATAATRNDENPLWSQLNGDPMIGQYSDVSVALSSQSIDSASGLLSPMDLAAKSFSGLNPISAAEADVSVNVANVASFAPLSKLNLSIGATTVIAADPWNAGGAKDVAAHFPSSPDATPAVPMRVAGAILNLPGVGTVLNTLAKLFVDTGLPTLGCIKPDVVPVSVASGVTYDSKSTGGDNQCD